MNTVMPPPKSQIEAVGGELRAALNSHRLQTRSGVSLWALLTCNRAYTDIVKFDHFSATGSADGCNL